MFFHRQYSEHFLKECQLFSYLFLRGLFFVFFVWAVIACLYCPKRAHCKHSLKICSYSILSIFTTENDTSPLKESKTLLYLCSKWAKCWKEQRIPLHVCRLMTKVKKSELDLQTLYLQPLVKTLTGMFPFARGKESPCKYSPITMYKEETKGWKQCIKGKKCRHNVWEGNQHKRPKNPQLRLNKWKPPPPHPLPIRKVLSCTR